MNSSTFLPYRGMGGEGVFPEQIALIWRNCQQDKLSRGGAFQTLSYTVDLNSLLTQRGVQWWWHFCRMSVFSPLNWPVGIHVSTGFVQELYFAAVLLWGCSTKSWVSLQCGQLHFMRGCCTLQLMLRWLHMWCEICYCDYSICASQICSSPLLSLLSPFLHSLTSTHIPVYIPLLFSAQCFPSCCFSKLTHHTSPLHFNVCPLVSLSNCTVTSLSVLKSTSEQPALTQVPRYHRYWFLAMPFPSILIWPIRLPDL